MTRPKVSVIMTTYNCVAYIKRSCESLFRQTLKDIELVCIDGGSTDGTLEYINKLMEKDTRVKLYPEEGRGIGGAKNTGIKYATGEYIAFLDADDTLVDSSALEKMYYTCKCEGVRVCGGLRSVFFEPDKVELDPLHRADIANKPHGVRLKYNDRQYDYHFHCYIYDSSLMKDENIRFAERLCFDDTHYFIRAMLAAKEFYVIPVEYYRYTGGPPYVWDEEHTIDALEEMIDQLKVSKANHLLQLHYLTLLRINNEFSYNFISNIRSGNLYILKLLIEANETIDIDMISGAFVILYPCGYLESMIRMKKEDIDSNNMYYAKSIFIKPLWEIIYADENKREIQRITDSVSYKIGRSITFIPRCIRSFFRKKSENERTTVCQKFQY